MAIPQPKPRDWQIANANELQVTDRQVLQLLRDAKRNVDRILKDLPEGSVKRAQLEHTRSLLLAQQSTLFEKLGDTVAARRASAASRAARLSAASDAALLKLVGKSAEAKYLYDSALQVGQRAIDAAMQRMKLSALPLSQRIYNTSVWMNGRLGKLINETLASGLDARAFAKRARDWFNPNTPGGVRYAAMRLARTEINNAFHSISAEKYATTPWCTEVDWNLSKSHPKPDICNKVAADSPFPKDEVPARPHPQCMCYITAKYVDEKDFIDNFLKGDYDEYLDAELEKEGWQEPAAKQPPLAIPAVATNKPQPEVTPPSPLNVLDRNQAIFAQHWQSVSDPEERAGGLWSESFFGLNAVRNGIRNRKAGKDVLAGTDLRRGQFDIFRDHIDRDDENSPQLYSEADFRNDVISAAELWEQKLQTAPVHKKALYRGLRLNADRMYAEGETFTQDVSSWTEDRGWASVYANTEDEGTGHVGDLAVIIKIVGPKHSADIDGIVGPSQRGSKEHIASGQYRVRKVTGKGKKFTVEVEEIPWTESARQTSPNQSTTLVNLSEPSQSLKSESSPAKPAQSSPPKPAFDQQGYQPGNWEQKDDNEAQLLEIQADLKKANPALTDAMARTFAEKFVSGTTSDSDVLYRNGKHEVRFSAPVSEEDRLRFLTDFDYLQSTFPAGHAMTVTVAPSTDFGFNVGGETTLGTGAIFINARVLTQKVWPGMPASANVSSSRYVLAHEWGHAVSTPEEAREKHVHNTAIKAGGLSRYGTVGADGVLAPAEGYAEAFAEWTLTNGKTTNPATLEYAKHFHWGERFGTH